MSTRLRILQSNQPVRSLVTLALSVALLFSVGCHSTGPRTIPRDRFDYSTALADSWKGQMLLNLVKTRYLDVPIYLEVGQIVSGYSLETGVTISGQLAKTGAGDQFIGAEASGRFTDRPTITYTPLTGEKFLEGFLGPVDASKVFALVQSGYAADFILEMGLESLNGLRNRPVSLASRHKADPEFYRALSLFREVQDAAAIGMKVERSTNNQPATLLFFRGERLDPDIQAKIIELRQLLGLAPDHSTFRLVSSPLKGTGDQLTITTRSLSQMLAGLSLGVEVPTNHVQRNLAPPMAPPSPGETPLLRVRSGPTKPANAFVAVSYESAWFWIAHDDWRSKRTFASLVFLFTLADAKAAENLPTITIPAQ